jgi:hypothetical protein
MEAVGVAVGVIALPISLIQMTEKLIEYTQHLGSAPAEVVELRDELKVIRHHLFLVRDLVERQATEDADPTLLSALVSVGGLLADELEIIRRLIPKSFQRPSAASRFKSAFAIPQLKVSIKKLKSSRLTLELLLQNQSLLLLIRENSASERTPVEPSIIARWLDQSSHDNELEQYAIAYHSGREVWLFREPSFNNWKENPGRLLWCTGMRKSCLRPLM